MGLDLLKDRDWALIEDKLCLVTEFVPMATIQGSSVSAMLGAPFASVRLTPDKGVGDVTGFITHKIDFMMLWAAFNKRRDVSGTRVQFGPVVQALASLPDGIEDTVEKFRTFYAGLLKSGGEQKLRAWLAQERISARNLEAGEKHVFLTVVNHLEQELLGAEEVWLTWTRNRYKAGVPRMMAQLLPKLIVMVAKKGAFELLREPSLRPDLEGQAYAMEVVPLITWTPEVME